MTLIDTTGQRDDTMDTAAERALRGRIASAFTRLRFWGCVPFDPRSRAERKVAFDELRRTHGFRSRDLRDMQYGIVITNTTGTLVLSRDVDGYRLTIAR